MLNSINSSNTIFSAKKPLNNPLQLCPIGLENKSDLTNQILTSDKSSKTNDSLKINPNNTDSLNNSCLMNATKSIPLSPFIESQALFSLISNKSSNELSSNFLNHKSIDPDLISLSTFLVSFGITFSLLKYTFKEFFEDPQPQENDLMLDLPNLDQPQPMPQPIFIPNPNQFQPVIQLNLPGG